VHVVLTLLYGFTIWFSLMAYAVITGLNLGLVVIGGPVVVSGAVAAIIGLDFALCKLRRLWS
jgi:hypothetical protein